MRNVVGTFVFRSHELVCEGRLPDIRRPHHQHLISGIPRDGDGRTGTGHGRSLHHQGTGHVPLAVRGRGGVVDARVVLGQSRGQGQLPTASRPHGSNTVRGPRFRTEGIPSIHQSLVGDGKVPQPGEVRFVPWEWQGLVRVLSLSAEAVRGQGHVVRDAGDSVSEPVGRVHGLGSPCGPHGL